MSTCFDQDVAIHVELSDTELGIPMCMFWFRKDEGDW